MNVIHPDIDTGLFFKIKPDKTCDSRHHDSSEHHADGGPIWWFRTACLCPDGYRCDQFRLTCSTVEKVAEERGTPMVCISCGTPIRPGSSRFLLVES